MPIAQEFGIPPRALFGDILRAVIRNIIPAVHRFDSIPSMALKPVAPERVDVETVAAGILFSA